jgi:hypothetical protein
MQPLLLVIVFISHFFINQLQNLFNRKIIYQSCGIIFLSLFLYFTTKITYTADYDMYSNFYDWNYDETDFLFRNLITFYHKNNWGFHALFATHVVAITLLFYFFIVKLNANVFYILSIFIAVIFIPYINQIRYFLAFPFFLLASYYLFYSRNLFLFFLFGLLGALSHSGVIVLYSYFLFYLFVPERFHSIILKYTAAVLFLASYLLFNTSFYLYFDHFGEYLRNGNQSSILGGIFNVLPILATLVPLFLLDKKYTGNRQDKTYLFLKRTSFFTVAFIPASIFIQIIGQRYVFPFLVVWIMFFLFLLRDKKISIRNRYIIFSYLFLVFILYLQYRFGEIFFGKSFYYEELKETLKSIKNY